MHTLHDSNHINAEYIVVKNAKNDIGYSTDIWLNATNVRSIYKSLVNNDLDIGLKYILEESCYFERLDFDSYLLKTDADAYVIFDKKTSMEFIQFVEKLPRLTNIII